MAIGPGGQFAVSSGGGAQPRWRGDGKELYFIAPAAIAIGDPVTAFHSNAAAEPFYLRHPVPAVIGAAWSPALPFTTEPQSGIQSDVPGQQSSASLKQISFGPQSALVVQAMPPHVGTTHAVPPPT